MATVAQESPLFNLSILENIRVGGDATDEEVVVAAKAANVDEAIREAGGLRDTGWGGGPSFVRWPAAARRHRQSAAAQSQLLILDECTSSLDAATEQAINSTIEKLRGDRIILSVTHRLQSSMTMDKIIVLRSGRVAESGTHAELLARKGVYAELWANQSGLAGTQSAAR